MTIDEMCSSVQEINIHGEKDKNSYNLHLSTPKINKSEIRDYIMKIEKEFKFMHLVDNEIVDHF